jgi:hypothetical protein
MSDQADRTGTAEAWETANGDFLAASLSWLRAVLRLEPDAAAGDVASAAEAVRLAEAQAERLRAEVEAHALANGGCVPQPAYRDLSAVMADVKAERDRLAATVERVEALADHYARCAKAADRKRRRSAQRYKAAELWLRAALDDPATTPETPHAPAGAPESTSGQSGTGEALGGAENGGWRARCDVPGCGWVSLPYKRREGADTAAFDHWTARSHGTTVGKADR